LKRRYAIALWLLAMAGCGWLIGRSPPMNKDLTYFLPRNPGVADRILIEQLRSGYPSRMILLALSHAEQHTLAELSNRLVQQLRSGPEFERVDNGHALWSEADARLVADHRYLLSPAVVPGAFDVVPLRRQLEARLSELTSSAGLVTKRLLPGDPTGETLRVLELLGGRSGPRLKDGVWFSEDGARALLVARTREPGFDLDAQTRAVGRIERTFHALAGGGSAQLALSGPGPFSVSINQAISDDAERISAVTMAAAGLFLFSVYRSLRFVLLTLLPLGCGALAGMAAVTLHSGSVHGIMLGFGSALIGFANDYPIHLFTHLSPQESGESAVRRVWPMIRLGVAATVAAFAAMLFSGFPGLVDLGVFSIVGLIAAGLVCRWVMPAFIPHGFEVPAWPGVFLSLDHLGGRRPWIVCCAVGVIVAAASASNSGPLWDDDIAHLTPLPESSQRFDEQLRSELGAPDLNRMIMILGDSQEAALQRSEEIAGTLYGLVAEGVLSRFDLAAQVLPSAATQSRRQQALPDPNRLSKDLVRAAEGLPFAAGTFAPFVEAVTAARSQRPLALADLQGSALALAVNPLLFPYADQWVALITLVDVTDPARIAAAVEGGGVHFVDLRQESTRLITHYRRETLLLLGFGACMIALLLRWGLGGWSAVGRVLLPMGLALLVTGAVARSASGGLSLFHLISLLLVMGLAMDYGLFFNRASVDDEDHRRTQLSLLVCTVTTILAFGVLTWSETPLLRAIGGTVALGAASAFLFAALLARPGRISA
jgi:predicted exporter